MVAANPSLSSAELIRTLCEIAGPRQGDATELGAMDSGDKALDHEMAQVNTGGRISMPASFDNMRELLTTLGDTLPNNAFSRKWLQTRVQKEESLAGNGYIRNKFRG